MWFVLLISTPLPSQAMRGDAGRSIPSPVPPWNAGDGWPSWQGRARRFLSVFQAVSDVFPKTFSLVPLGTAAGKLLPEGGEKTPLMFKSNLMTLEQSRSGAAALRGRGWRRWPGHTWGFAGSCSPPIYPGGDPVLRGGRVTSCLVPGRGANHRGTEESARAQGRGSTAACGRNAYQETWKCPLQGEEWRPSSMSSPRLGTSIWKMFCCGVTCEHTFLPRSGVRRCGSVCAQLRSLVEAVN